MEHDQGISYLQALCRLTDAVGLAGSIEDVYEQALNALEQGLEAHRSAILLFDDDGVVRFKAWRGLSAEYRQNVEGHYPWEKGDSNPKSILVEDVEAADELSRWRHLILREGIRAIGFIPLISQGIVLGKFMLYYNQPHHFSEGSVLMAETIARQVSFAIDSRKKEQKLQSALQEKELLMREIHHRVNNNLQMVSSMLSLQLKSLKDGATPNALKESISRVQTMAVVHDELYGSTSSSPFSFSQYVKRLIDHLLRLYSSDRQIRVELDCMDCKLKNDFALRMGLILNEIVSNSLQHAFRNRDTGRIFIRMPDSATLVVGDDGVGLPDEIQPEAANSMGLKMVRLFTESMNASIRRLPGPGTVFEIRIPPNNILEI